MNRFALAGLFILAIGAATLATSHCSYISDEAKTIRASAKQKLLETYRNMPLAFEARQDGSFVSRSEGYSLLLTGSEAVVRLASSEVRLKPLNANPAPPGEGLEQLPGRSNYLLGNDSRHWRTNVVGFAKVRYGQVWPGIDLVYYGNQRRLEYDFIVTPGADPANIALRFDGALSVAIDAAGDLLLGLEREEVRMLRPIVYQQVGAERQEVDGRYVINDRREVGFAIGEYDHSQALVIDPVLSYAASFDSELINGIALDANGAVYFTGVVRSAVFPISPNALRTARGETNLSAPFVAKLNAEGTALIYSTYIGGFSGLDFPYGIAVDSGGNAYLVGRAGSSAFPVTPGAFQQTFAGPGQVGNNFLGDGFVLKLNGAGDALVYSTFLGGLGHEDVLGVAVDGEGSAYVCGTTGSANFPISPDAAQRGLSSPFSNGFVTKLNAEGSSFVWSTFVATRCRSVAVDAQGDAYATGSDFGLTYAVKIIDGGRKFGYRAGLSGNLGFGEGLGIAIDGSGNAYVTGRTGAGLQTTAGVFQPSFGGAQYDAFVAKLFPTGSIAYLSYLGGSGNDHGTAIAADASGNAYVVGNTGSGNFPLLNAFQPNSGNGTTSSDLYQTAFVTKVNPNGSATVFSSYYGAGVENATSIGLPGPDQVIIAGQGAALSSGARFSPNPAPFFRYLDGPIRSFITRIDETVTGTTDLLVSLSPSDKLYNFTINSYVATVTNIGTIPSSGPILLLVDIASSPNIRNATGEGWYGTESPGNLVVRSYPGSLAPGQSAKLLIEFSGAGPESSLDATATITNLSDFNTLNNTVNDTSPVATGCFNGGFVTLTPLFPAEGGTFTHPVSLSCPNPWKATSNVNWITINSAPMTGSGSFSYTIGRNVTGLQRQGTIVFEGTAIEIGQDFLPGLVNLSAASYRRSAQGTQPELARDSIIALFGKDLSTATVAAESVPLPTKLAGTTVTITDSFGTQHEAPLFFVSPAQINYLLPKNVATGFATITVTNNTGKVQTGTLPVVDISPGLFSANADGRGVPAAVLVRVKADGSQSFEPVAEYSQSQQVYVPRAIDFGPDGGDHLYLVLFGTGFRNRASPAKTSIRAYPHDLPALYEGPQGDFVGLDQINVQLKRELIIYGAVGLILYADGIPSNGLLIEFKR